MFNDKQEQVISEQKNNILLLASAGTGKTNTLAYRIAKILKEGLAKTNEILCITFTNKACKEMKERISMAYPDGRDIEVKTFHGLCFDIIKKEAKKNTDVASDFIIYDEEDCLALIKDEFNKKVKSSEIKEIIDFIKTSRLEYGFVSASLKRDLNKTIKKILSDDERLNNFLDSYKKNKDLIEETIKTEGIQMVIKYQNIMKKYGALDFIDLITNTMQLFNNEDIVKSIASQYKYINIDEIQDTSIVEYNLIEKIFCNNNILLCGDIFQTIYEWRGSAPFDIIRMFKKKYSPIEITFDKNYRATRRLTDCATEYLNNAFPAEYSEIFKSGLSSSSNLVGDKIPFHTCGNIKQEAKWIYNQIKSLPPLERKKTCILTRNNNYNILLSKELQAISDQELDFTLVDDTKFFRKKEIKDIIAFLKIAVNNYDCHSLKRILRTLDFNIKEELIQEIESEECKRAGITITDFIDKNTNMYNDKYELLEKELYKENIVVFDVESTGTDTSRDEIIQIAAIRINSKGEEIERFVEFLKPSKSVGSSESVHGFSDEYLTEHGKDKKKTIEEFLKFIEGRTIVGHNVQYDINILTSEIERNNLSKTNYTAFFDTLDIYRRFYPSLENHKLNTLSMIINTKHKPNHNALYDILATGEILVYAVEKFIKPTKKERVALTKTYKSKFSQVSKDMNEFFEKTKDKRPMEVIQIIVKDFDLLSLYGTDSEEANNMRQFYFTAKHNDDLNLSPRDALIDFTTIVTLSDGEMEKILMSKGKIPIITIHSSKGLEFDYIFLAGLQDEVFPTKHSLEKNYLDEEMRVFYVAITRAKKRLYMTYSKYTRGSVQEKSRLISLLDSKYIRYA